MDHFFDVLRPFGGVLGHFKPLLGCLESPGAIGQYGTVGSSTWDSRSRGGPGTFGVQNGPKMAQSGYLWPFFRDLLAF